MNSKHSSFKKIELGLLPSYLEINYFLGVLFLKGFALVVNEYFPVEIRKN